AGLLILSVAASGPGRAQPPTPQPRLDPKETERTFDTFRVEQQRARRTAVPVPRTAWSEPQADTRPLFKLTAMAVEGARSVPGEVIAETYRSYLGKTVSQADLVAIANKVSDLYRDAGYHLSRAIVPPQDIKDGRI